MPDTHSQARWSETQARQASAPTAVLFDAPFIRYRITGELRATRQLSELRRVIDVNTASELFTSYTPFSLLDFGDSLWVVPHDVPLETHHAWAEYLRSVAGFFQATVEGTPEEYLDRGLIGLFRKLTPKIITGNQLPVHMNTWHMEGPLDPLTYAPTVTPAQQPNPR